MNSRVLIILFCFLFSSAWGSDDTIISFHKSSIKLPKGFKEFSKDELASFRATVFNRRIMTVYEKDDETAGLQRIIFYYDSLEGTKQLRFNEILRIKLEVIKESGIIFNKTKTDEAKHYAFGTAIVAGDTSIFGFSVDGFGIMGIQFDDSKGINEAGKKEFDKIMNSVKHYASYQYVPEKNPKAEEAKKEMGESGILLVVAFFGMISIWLVRRFLVKK
ncbi:hypothetical protein D3C71_637270 [compost metagenome]